MKILVALCPILLLAACTPQQQLLRHYEHFSTQAPARSEALGLSVFLANPEAAVEAPFVLQLTERAQAELIRSVAARVSKDGGSAELMTLLTSPTDVVPAKCAWASKTNFSKRLVVNVLGDLPTPADRIDKLDIVLTLEGDNADRARFLSWDRFTSKYGDFNIGAAKFTQANKLSADFGNTRSNAAADATSSIVKVLGLNYEKGNSLEETASYALHRLTVGGELSAKKARLVQEGAPNYTLFGSSVATVSLAVSSGAPARVHSFKLLKEGTPLAPPLVQIESCPDIYPKSSAPITATIAGTAQVRLVKSGGATVTESDDHVLVVTQSLVADPITLISNSELAVDRFALGRCHYEDKKEAVCKYLYVATDRARTDDFERVVLPSVENAAELRSWIVEQSQKGAVSTIANRRVGLSGEAPGVIVDIKTADAVSLVALALPVNSPSEKSTASAGK